MNGVTNDKITTCLTQDIKAAIAILERIRFKVGPEFLRKDITRAIKLLEDGLAQGTTDGESKTGNY